MRKHIYLLIFAVLGLMTSCGSDDITENNAELEGAVFTAETEMPGDTRTSLSPDRYIYWTEGDHIGIFNKSTSLMEYELTSGGGTCNGSFHEYAGSGSGSASSTALSRVVALYPYTAGCTITEVPGQFFRIKGMEIPSEQTYAENSFSQGSMPMIAVTDGSNLKFKNVGALVKLNVKASAPGVKIQKITLETADNTVVSGKFMINVGKDGSNPSVLAGAVGSSIVTLSCPSVEISESTATTFYISVPALDFPKGFVIKIYDSSSSVMQLKSKACSIQRNQILAMPTIAYKGTEIEVPKKEPTEGEWIDLGLPSGIKWASRNLGASTPEAYGNYYSWGETAPKSSYYISDYLYCEEDANGHYQYYSLGDISGSSIYDAARVNLGAPARMPKQSELDELTNTNNCTWTWKTINGVNGMLVKSVRNGNSIFLPAAGRYISASLILAGEYGCYWGSTPYEHNNLDVYLLVFDAKCYSFPDSGCSRCDGLSVRPVQD